MKLSTLPLVVVVMAPLAAAAQDVAQKPPKVAVVNLQGIFRDSVLGKDYAGRLDVLQKDLDAEVAKRQKEVEAAGAVIAALQDELEKQGAVLAEEVRDRKQRELVRKNRERQALVEDGRRELEGARQRAEQQAETLRNEFQGKIRPFILTVSKEKGIDILLEAEAATVAVLGKDADLTGAVVAKVDEAEKAPKATATPAAPAPQPKP
jgi:Skp family chaperone for outer membrane proteins